MYFWISAFDHRAIVVPKMHIVHWSSSQKRWSLIALGWMIVDLTVWARWRHNNHYNHRRRRRHCQHHHHCGSSEETEEAEATEPETTFSWHRVSWQRLAHEHQVRRQKVLDGQSGDCKCKWIEKASLTQTIKLSTFIRPVLKKKFHIFYVDRKLEESLRRKKWLFMDTDKKQCIAQDLDHDN